MLDYFGKLSAKWEEILNYKPLPDCSCEAREKIFKEYQEERIHQFLMGLDKTRFGNVCTNIIGMEPLPDLDNVYQRVVREERQLSSSRVEQKQDVIGFTTRVEFNASSGSETHGIIAAIA